MGGGQAASSIADCHRPSRYWRQRRRLPTTQGVSLPVDHLPTATITTRSLPAESDVNALLAEPISLTQFFPFVLADSIGKRAELRAIKRSIGSYSPAVDYWRLLRLQIMSFHQFEQPVDSAKSDALDHAIELAHPDRVVHYRTAITNYRRVFGRKRVEWIGRPRRGMWLADGLQVRVNPELHLTIDGEPHVVKLYLKADRRWALSQRTANPMAYLLHACHGHLGTPLVVDLMRGRAFRLTRHGVDYESLLRAQAAAFRSLWESEEELAA